MSEDPDKPPACQCGLELTRSEIRRGKGTCHLCEPMPCLTEREQPTDSAQRIAWAIENGEES